MERYYLNWFRQMERLSYSIYSKYSGRTYLFLLSSFISILFFSIGYIFYALFMHSMLSRGQAAITFSVPKNTTAAQFAHILKIRHLLYSENLLLFFIRMQGLAQQLKAGVYLISPGETVSQFLSVQ